MIRRNFVTALLLLSCNGRICPGLTQDQLIIDATEQPSPPVRARGPFPGSSRPGHSPGLPIQIGLKIRTGELRSDGTMLVDFTITNVGPEPITLPTSIDQTIDRTDVLTLWFTSDGIQSTYMKDQQTSQLVKFEAVGTSAELNGRSNDPRTFHVLAPNATILVHASSRVGINPGLHSFTGHAELLRVSYGARGSVGVVTLGTAEAVPVQRIVAPLIAR
jgi:hypothetical protein